MKMEIDAEAWVAVFIEEGLSDPAAPLDPPLSSEAETENRRSI